jgi:CheY-like chemotaxis protein
MHKLLIVDDSRASQLALKSQLDSDALTIRTASSAAEAWIIIKTFRPDCVLTDYEMPEVDGPSLCRSIKAASDLQNTPVIVLTSMSSTDHLLTAIDAGADDFISKDSDIRVIIAKIKAMLRLKAYQDELAQMRRADGIKQMITTYNHEFNNPLTIAIGNLNWLRDHTTDDAHTARIKRLSDALSRMAELVKKIRDLRDFVEARYTESANFIELNKSTPNRAG